MLPGGSFIRENDHLVLVGVVLRDSPFPQALERPEVWGDFIQEDTEMLQKLFSQYRRRFRPYSCLLRKVRIVNANQKNGRGQDFWGHQRFSIVLHATLT